MQRQSADLQEESVSQQRRPRKTQNVIQRCWRRNNNVFMLQLSPGRSPSVGINQANEQTACTGSSLSLRFTGCMKDGLVQGDQKVISTKHATMKCVVLSITSRQGKYVN